MRTECKVANVPAAPPHGQQPEVQEPHSQQPPPGAAAAAAAQAEGDNDAAMDDAEVRRPAANLAKAQVASERLARQGCAAAASRAAAPAGPPAAVASGTAVPFD